MGFTLRQGGFRIFMSRSFVLGFLGRPSPGTSGVELIRTDFSGIGSPRCLGYQLHNLACLGRVPRDSAPMRLGEWERRREDAASLMEGGWKQQPHARL